MEAKQYEELGTDWQTDSDIACCTTDPSDNPSGCDCCYDTWKAELKVVSRDYSKLSEQSYQLTEHQKFVAGERDKLKVWKDDLEKTNLLAKILCDQFKVISSQTEKICTNSEKSSRSIEILFCMIRDLYEQTDLIVTIWNQIDNCIKCLNSDDLPPDSGIRKCLGLYMVKVEAVLKTRTELIKSIMAAVKIATVLHEGICSEYGFHKVITEWSEILNCDEKCSGSAEPLDPCADKSKMDEESLAKCKLKPILTLPICNDSYYAWVKEKYDKDVVEADKLSDDLVEINKKKEGLAACLSSLTAAIKEVDPKELCK